MTWLLRLVVVAGLAWDAYVHVDLASGYDAVTGTVSQGTLFRVEAAAAIAAGLLVLLVRRRPVYLLAAAVALGGLAAVLVYRYVDVGALGPFPNMYEPIWYQEKVTSAVAQGVAGIAAIALLAIGSNRPGLRG
jgi:hypothetical protein